MWLKHTFSRDISAFKTGSPVYFIRFKSFSQFPFLRHDGLFLDSLPPAIKLLVLRREKVMVKFWHGQNIGEV